MLENQNVAMFVENIHTLAKLYGMKIGEVEDKAGISRGYVSRLKKAGESANIQDDTVKKIADVFGCSAKAILCHDLKNMGKDDLYYFDFVLKLYEDTQHGIVVWDVDDLCPEEISQEEYNNHPYKNFHHYREQENGDGCECESEFLSDGLGGKAFVQYNGLWTCQIGENVKLLFVAVDIWQSEIWDSPAAEQIQNTNEYHAELYLEKNGEFLPLCASYRDNELGDILIDLWGWLFRYGDTSIRLTDEIREVIDEFMGKKHNVSEEQSVEKVGITDKKNISLQGEAAKKALETMLKFNSRSKKVVDM